MHTCLSHSQEMFSKPPKKKQNCDADVPTLSISSKIPGGRLMQPCHCGKATSYYNGRAERNRQHFEVAKIFREIDPRRGGGWVLIVMRVILICDIDWDKSGLRNLKNQNLKFPSAGTTFPSVGATFQSARTKNAIPKRQLPQARYLLDCPFQKLGSRMDAPISTPGIDFNERLPTFKK